MSAVTYPWSSKLRCQVAAVCYRRGVPGIEFLLVNTDSGKWTFPKGAVEPHLSHSQAAAKEALEEAGATGLIERRHFHIYLHGKGVFWCGPGVREFAVKAFLMQVQRAGVPEESRRNPTWFDPERAKIALAYRREIKYSDQLSAVIDRALARIHAHAPRPCLARLSRHS
jgi:8-oxo-dGTP pyrophosphatase MutT (NUDIX family)